MDLERKFFQLKIQEWIKILPLLLLLGVDAVVGQFAEVVATAGFINQLGINQLPWMWIVSMVISVSATSMFALVVDQSKRVNLMGWVLVGFVSAYGLVALLLGVHAPDLFVYPLLYMITEVQYSIFPLALWALAGDLFSLADSRRLFPIIAAGATVGNILGNALAALFAPASGGTFWAMGLTALLYALTFVMLRLTVARTPVRARKTTQVDAKASFVLKIKEDLHVGRDFFANVPLFRNLAITMFLAGLGFTILEFYFLHTVDLRFANKPAEFQTFYSLYKILLYGLLWLVQAVLSAYLVKRTELKRSFTALPITLSVGLLVMVAFPNFLVVVISQFIARVVQWGWDHPSRSVLLGLVPDERRGRISSFINSFVYAMSTLVGSLVILIFLGLEHFKLLGEAIGSRLYLVLALLTALGAIWFSVQLRNSYEKSLLNWRLSRSKRKSVLDGLEFK
jgi:ATP:ADP antiporter, AAA family